MSDTAIEDIPELVSNTTPLLAFSSDIESHQEAWDSTSLGELKTCARKYYYRIILGVTTRGMNPHLMFGIVYHAALENYDHARAKGMTHEEGVELAILYALTATWDEKLQRPWTTDEPTKCRNTLLRTIVWYLMQFEEDPAETLILRNGKPAVELSFRFETGLKSNLTGTPYMLCGHMDRLAEFNGQNWILDKKTTKSVLSNDYASRYSPDNQISLYAIAGSLILDKPVAGLIIDAAQVGVTFARYQRFIVNRTKAQLSEWLQDLEYWLRMAEYYAKTNYWPMNDKACGLFGGCPYRQVCGVSPSAREPLLRGLYTVEPWDPLKVRGENL